MRKGINMTKEQAQTRLNEINLILKHTRFHAMLSLNLDGTYSIVIEDSFLLAEKCKNNENF